MTKKGQIAIEGIVTLPLIFVSIVILGTQFVRLSMIHLSWVDLVTLHRARLYSINTRCEPHSFWPQSFRQKFRTRCLPIQSEIRSDFKEMKNFRQEIRWKYQ